MPGQSIRSVLACLFFFFFNFFFFFLDFGFFPCLGEWDGHTFFSRHIMRVRLLTIYMPHWHRAIYFIDLLYRYPRRILNDAQTEVMRLRLAILRLFLVERFFQTVFPCISSRLTDRGTPVARWCRC